MINAIVAEINSNINCYIFTQTYGADESKHLGIPGETLKNCIEARRIVGWYNGLPSDSNLEIDLSIDTAAVFGQGNVAVDVARIFLTPVDSLRVIIFNYSPTSQIVEYLLLFNWRNIKSI